MPPAVLLLSLALVVVSVLGRPQDSAPVANSSPQGVGSTPVPIISQSAETKEDGGFSYSFETGNGIKVEESGSLKEGPPSLQGRSAGSEGEDGNNTLLVLQGSFSYTGPDGHVYSVKYVADENGFQPEGDHLPTPPPGLEGVANRKVQTQVQSQVKQQVQNLVQSQLPSLNPTTELSTTVQ
ncbi:cuticle protein CP14.6-like [Euwallacea fornicatus]|uniref:cuticle protein CP14.6-like n=1 Tax=Euwallacea fornicatus TaxID=995702 RepID=UPI0033902EA4